MNYCTLFDSNYSDKGIVMIDSLINVDAEAKVYVLCMDEKCKTILDDWYQTNVTTISLDEFEDEDLLGVKNQRSKGEYCWTCTGKLIKHVIIKYNCDVCTYVDSDLFFYSSPQVLLNEMVEADCSVQIIPHRFPPTFSGRYQEKSSGKNCVQFNTFSSSTESMKLLDQWIAQCLDECSVNSSGDQKYTSEWGDYSFVNVSQNKGAGIAPWNLTRFEYLNNHSIYDRYDKEQWDIVFYHFQNITYIDANTVQIMPKVQYWIIDDQLLNFFYKNYLVKIEEVKKILKKHYGLSPMIKEYIADKEKKHKTIFEKIKYAIHSSPVILFLKIDSLIRYKIRKKNTYIKLDKLIKG